MSAVKEPGFFSNDDIWVRGVEWYSQIFHKKHDKCLVGEASNVYSALNSNPSTIDRMRRVLDEETKFIYCVRNPIKRTESDFMHATNDGAQADFSDFIRNDAAYRDKNSYKRTLDAYRSAFGEENVMVIFFEDLVAETHREVAKVCDFLNVRKPDVLDSSAHGITSRQMHLPNAVRRIQGSATYAKFSHRLPSKLKTALRTMLGKEVTTTRPAWRREDFETFVQEHRPDAIQFLKLMGKSTEHWSFDKTVVKLEVE